MKWELGEKTFLYSETCKFSDLKKGYKVWLKGDWWEEAIVVTPKKNVGGEYVVVVERQSPFAGGKSYRNFIRLEEIARVKKT